MRFWDTSALVALLVEEPTSDKRAAQLREDPRVVVWWATWVECESSIQRRVREGSLVAAGERVARARLQQLSGACSEVAPSEALRSLASRLPRTHPPRVADALQLSAALTLLNAARGSLRFVCGDERLNRAAEIEGLLPLP